MVVTSAGGDRVPVEMAQRRLQDDLYRIWEVLSPFDRVEAGYLPGPERGFERGAGPEWIGGHERRLPRGRELQCPSQTERLRRSYRRTLKPRTLKPTRCHRDPGHAVVLEIGVGDDDRIAVVGEGAEHPGDDAPVE